MVNKITTPPTTSELIGKVNEIIDDKQDTLVSGTNIKTINNTSILGSGNIDIQGGGSSYTAGTGIDITNNEISVDSSIVTTNTVQTITSQKTFNGKISVKDISNLMDTTILETYAGNTNVGTSNTSLVLKSNLTRPYMNNTSTQLALLSDVPTDTSDITNGAGYITSSALTGYATETWVGQQGYITGITSSDVTTALGYTPYNSSNPDGYITSSALTPYVLSSSLATVATSGDYDDLINKPIAGTGIDITNDVISVEGVKDQQNTSTAIKTWTGTKAQYDAIVSKDNNTLYHITDDKSSITTALNTLVQTTQAAITALINSIYPIGSIYLTVSNDNPATLLGLGTWQKVASGRVLQGADNDHAAGTTIAAGLPNITGETYSTNNSAASHYANTYRGVFRGRNTGGTSYYAGNPVSSSDTNVGISFDASRSNAIYGKSNTVQPPAYVVNVWQRVA